MAPGIHAQSEEVSVLSNSENNTKPAEEQKGNRDEPDEKSPQTYFSELAARAEGLVERTDWSYVSMEFANIELLWEEGPDAGETDLTDFRGRIDRAREKHEEIKKRHYEEQERVRLENLEKKRGLLGELRRIVEQENWTHEREVKRIRAQWEQVRPLPSGTAEELQEQFGRLISEFESHKVDRIVKKKEKEEENLVGKLLILDKMDALLTRLESEETDWPEADTEMRRLNRQWHKIGRVPAEKNQETWDRYHGAQQNFHEIRFRKDKSYRQQIESFLERKKALIREAEALVDDDDIASAARRVNKLHRRWKKVGNLPQKEENELWERFKSATDSFNERKSGNMDLLRDQEQQNLEKKRELIARAEELKDSEEWDRTHGEYQRLMEEWKASGPVPRRLSGKVWKEFKSSMDHFYERRRNHLREVRKRRKGNLEEKREVLDKLRSLVGHENPIEAVAQAKPLQEKFREAGYVPIKFKNALWKEFREVCDEIYDRYRAARSAADLVGTENLSDYTTGELASIREMKREAGRLGSEISRLEEEVLQMKESLSYFKPSSKGSSLLDDLHGKLEKAEETLRKKQERLNELDREIDRLKEES